MMAAAGQHGQGEPDRPAEERIQQQQRQHGHGEVAQPGPPRAGAESGQGHQAHRRGPQHARLRPAQRDEGHHPEQTEDSQPPPADADPARGGQHERQQQGEVRPGDGGQMGQAGRRELRLQLGGQSRRCRPPPAPAPAPAARRPGRRPRRAAHRGPARPAAAAVTGPPVRTGSPRTRTTAATSDPRSGGCSLAQHGHPGPDRQPGPVPAPHRHRPPPAPEPAPARSAPPRRDLPHDGPAHGVAGPTAARRHQPDGRCASPAALGTTAPARARSATGPAGQPLRVQPTGDAQHGSTTAVAANHGEERSRASSSRGGGSSPSKTQDPARGPGAEPGGRPAGQGQGNHPQVRSWPCGAAVGSAARLPGALTPGRAGRSARTSSVRSHRPAAARTPPRTGRAASASR